MYTGDPARIKANHDLASASAPPLRTASPGLVHRL